MLIIEPPIEPPVDDDPSEPYLDESDIPADSFEVSIASQAAMIKIRMSLPRSIMHVPHHIHKKLSTAQIYNWMMIRSLLIMNQFLLLKEFSRNVKEKAKCNIRSNGSAIPKNQRKIFWIKVLSNISSMAKGEISENPIHSMFELQFSICFILRQYCVSAAK